MGQPQNGPDQPGETSSQEWEAGALEILAACRPLARRLVAFDRYMGEPVEFTEADQKAFLSFSDLHHHIFSLASPQSPARTAPAASKFAEEGKEANERLVRLSRLAGYNQDELLALMSLVALQQNSYPAPPVNTSKPVPLPLARKARRKSRNRPKK